MINLHNMPQQKYGFSADTEHFGRYRAFMQKKLFGLSLAVMITKSK